MKNYPRYIPPGIDFQEEKTFYIIVMPLMDYSLDDIMHEYLFLDTESVQKISIQMLKGLRDIHAQGYVHCDIKPQNLMVVEEKVQLTDKRWR